MHVIGKDEANRTRAKSKLSRLVRKHQLTTVVIGNGTACRETEQVVSEMISDLYAPPVMEPPAVEPSSPLEQQPEPHIAPTETAAEVEPEGRPHDADDIPRCGRGGSNQRSNGDIGDGRGQRRR